MHKHAASVVLAAGETESVRQAVQSSGVFPAVAARKVLAGQSVQEYELEAELLYLPGKHAAQEPAER